MIGPGEDVRVALDTSILATAEGLEGDARKTAAHQLLGQLRRHSTIVPAQALCELAFVLVRNISATVSLIDLGSPRDAQQRSRKHRDPEHVRHDAGPLPGTDPRCWQVRLDPEGKRPGYRTTPQPDRHCRDGPEAKTPAEHSCPETCFECEEEACDGGQHLALVHRRPE